MAPSSNAKTCNKCPSEINESDRFISCELCKSCFHLNCANINVKTFEVITKVKCVHWFCDSCNSEDLGAEISDLRKFREKHEVLVGKLDDVQNKYIEQSEQINRIENKLAELQYGTNIENRVTDILREQQEVEKRKLNLCVFNFDNGTENSDREEFVKLCTQNLHINIDSVNAGIVKMHRIVPKQNSSQSRTKILKVYLSCIDLKSEILKNAPKLKNVTRPGLDPSKKVFIAHDLTSTQQKQQKDLRMELHSRRDAGEDVIKYGKIVPKPINTHFPPSNSSPSRRYSTRSFSNNHNAAQ